MTDESEQTQLDELADTDTGGSTDDTDTGTVRTAESEPGGESDPAATTRTGEATETVEVGVALLAHLEDAKLSLAAAVDRVETVTTDPALTREILDTAELRGVIDREGGVVRPRSGSFVSFERDVVRREGEFTCRRCGASLSTGCFVQFDAGEHGPFGSSCIRRVTGRE
ncbi:MAG: hypothetical protein J07HX64_00178 [halophilic archaeon J07HX64]|nr:MAG: hypothetical protein J07HX64_00178 [halophilic archaeon J07HX64]